MSFQLRNSIATLLLVLMLAISACTATSESPADSVDTTAESSAGGDSAAQSDVIQSGDGVAKLNLNTVTGDVLQSTIPDFGNRMVREFHEYRPYISIQQFRREIGKYVDEAQVATYEQYVFVPVNVNESDAETLKQLPGVDDAIAEALMAARPFESNTAFLEALGASVSAEDMDVASGYLEAE